MAEMAKWDKKQLQVRCTLNTDWGNSEPTPLEIERAAVHELLHVVVEPLSSLIEERLHDSDLKLAAEHSAINRIEALLVPAPTEGL
jgi:hypothetical protein